LGSAWHRCRLRALPAERDFPSFGIEGALLANAFAQDGPMIIDPVGACRRVLIQKR